jgi:hypothetical protein
LVDNSISADAKNVWLTAHWSGPDSYLALIDDGHGMSQAELVSAMRPGSKSPVEEREPGDLGRFGLGLKTASFSQCRRMTVWSKRDTGRAAVRCWDLDYVSETQEWRLINKVDDSTRQKLDQIPKPDHGTIVLWEKLDRLVGEEGTDDTEAKGHFHTALDEVQLHLGMVFHRFISRRGLSLYVNGDDDEHLLRAWDPFLSDHVATQILSTESLHQGAVRVEPCVLPHHDKLSKKQHKYAGGPAGWNAQQGFYVYRNDRLLVAGSWLGLGFTKEEHYKLARIAVDFPSALDHAWHIDVKKSVARPPRTIRKRLRQLAELTRKRAVEVYRHRDPLQSRTGSEPTINVWRSSLRGEKTVYHINRDHPLVQACLTEAKESAPILNALFRLIEETMPVHHIWLDSVQNPSATGLPFEGITNQAILPLLKCSYVALRKNGHSPEEARSKLATFEGFSQFASAITLLNDEICGV